MVCNFRKTRKKGGVDQIASTVLVCTAPFDKQAECLKEFLKQNNFKLYEITGDGNCFYRTIAKYFELINTNIFPKNHMELRKIVVNAMINNYEEIQGFVLENENTNIESINNNNFKKKAIECNKIQEIKKLFRNGVWSSDTSDTVTQYAAKALNITLKIYNFISAVEETVYNSKTKKRKTVTIEPARFDLFTIPPDFDSGITINMLRVGDSHYQLLYPAAASAPAAAVPAPSRPSKNSAAAKEQAERNAAIAAVAAAEAAKEQAEINAAIAAVAAAEKAEKNAAIAAAKSTISRNMRKATLSGTEKKTFGSLNPHANTVSAKAPRKRPIVAPETNSSLERRLQAEENPASKSPKNTTRRRNPPRGPK